MKQTANQFKTIGQTAKTGEQNTLRVQIDTFFGFFSPNCLFSNTCPAVFHCSTALKR